MVVQTRPEIMYQMRQSGATLDQLGSRFGISRERARQLLIARYGSARVRKLLTTTELCRLVGCTWKYIDKLKWRGVIQPAMMVGHGRTLWKPESVVAVIEYTDRYRCPVCHRPVPSYRKVYCSRRCYLEARRYKNQPLEAKRRHNERVKRWRTEHPAEAKRIQQRKETKKSLERYRSTLYVIAKRCAIPLGTVVRVLTCNRGRMRVEWGEQVLDVPFGCVRLMENEAVAAK